MSVQTPDETPEPRTLRDEAALWFGRMQGPEADRHRATFEAWLARGALHRSAYNRAGEIYAMGKFLKGPQDRATDRSRRDEPQWPEDAAGRPVRISPRRTAVRIGSTCAVVLTVAIGMVLVSRGSLLVGARPSPMLRETRALVLVTRDHQMLTQMLEDGSRVTLAANSGLTIAYSRTTRHLSLDRGQAKFNVAHDRRPFIVNAACGSVTAHGTVFEVAMLVSKRVVVHLLEGQIAVAVDAHDHAQATRMLQRGGETISYATDGKGPIRSGILSARTPPSLAPDLAQSQDGLRTFQNVPLRDVLRLVNSRSHTAKLYAAPDIANLKVSGRFGVEDPLPMARRLAVLFDLKVDQSRGRAIMLRRS